MKITGLAHLAFKVSDMERSLDFYCNKLGLRKVFEIPFGSVMKSGRFNHPWMENRESDIWLCYLEFAPHQFIELFSPAPGMEKGIYDDDHVGYLHFALEVEDIQAAKAELEEAGVEIVSQPVLSVDRTWQMWVADPDGNRFELHQYTDESWQLR